MSTLESRRRAKELGPGKNREVDEAEGKRKGEPESTQIQTDQIANSKNNKNNNNNIIIIIILILILVANTKENRTR